MAVHIIKQPNIFIIYLVKFFIIFNYEIVDMRPFAGFGSF